MPDQLGRAITYSTPVTADHREILAALYAWFDGGNDPNWTIKGAAVIPAQIAAPGDTGFVVTNGSADIAIADHALVGGTMADGGAIGAGDDMMVGIDPGGGITNITSAGFSVGARWSGWTPNAEGATYAAHDGRCKISSGADWLFMRFKNTSGLYDGGAFAGKIARLDAGLGDGWALMSGLWSDFSATTANDHAYLESYSANWEIVRCAPGDDQGLQGALSSDGAGTFRTAPLVVLAPNGTISSAFSTWTAVGTIPALFTSANGTTAKQWVDGTPATVGYNVAGGCWVARDDGTDAE